MWKLVINKNEKYSVSICQLKINVWNWVIIFLFRVLKLNLIHFIVKFTKISLSKGSLEIYFIKLVILTLINNW